MSVIKVRCTDQSLTITDAPRIAAGGINENHVKFDFCEMWDGYAKIGVFFNIPYKPYKNIIGEDGVCLVPPEVTAYKGNMYFSVVGVNGDGVIRTSERISYYIDEGANGPGVELADPTDDIWEQCITEIAAAWAATIFARDKAAEAIAAAEETRTFAEEVEEAAGEAMELAKKHANRHAIGADDHISPESIGAAETAHEHFVSEIKNMPLLDRAYVDEDGTLHVKTFATGETASLPEMTVGTVETLEEGERATASIEGTVERPVLNLGIPMGATGAKGEKGEPGKGFKILGYYSTLEALEQLVTEAELGDSYCVGLAAPYNFYTWDGSKWIDNGLYAIPGKSAYEYAIFGGYGGTEDEFYKDLGTFSARLNNVEFVDNYSTDLTGYASAITASRMSVPIFWKERGEEYEKFRINSVGCLVTGAGTVRFDLYEWDGVSEGGVLTPVATLGEVTATEAGVVKLNFEDGYYTELEKICVVALSSESIIGVVTGGGIVFSDIISFEDADYYTNGGSISTEGEGSAFWFTSSDFSLVIKTMSMEEAMNDCFNKHLDADERFAAIEQSIADILYEKIAFTAFRILPSVAEIGDTVSTLTFSWVLNKEPAGLIIDGEEMENESLLEGTFIRAFASSEGAAGYTEDTIFSAEATDERGATATKSAKLYFYNGVYYGAGAEPEEIDTSFLTKVLTVTRKRSFTAEAGEGEYLWYVLPVRLGECSFKVGGFEGGFELYATVDYTNSFDYTEPYYIYRSTNAGLGETTVEVS